MTTNKDYMEQEAILENELSEEELTDVSGGGILLGITLIASAGAFGYGVYKGFTSGCRKKK